MRMSDLRSSPRSDRASARCVAHAVASGILLLLGALAALPAGAQSLAATDPPADSVLHLATFDTVWTRIADTHWDPEMGGLDWDAVRAELRPRAAAGSTDELRGVLREMLDRLGDSHFVLLPAGTAPDPDAPTATGETGLEVRWTDDQALVTRVEQGSPAAAAGLRPGHRIAAVDGRPVDDIVAGLEPPPGNPASDALPSYWLSAGLARHLRGEAGSTVELRVDRGDGSSADVPLVLEEPGEAIRFGHLPPFRLRVESHTEPLATGGEAGVLRFNGWFPAAAPEIAAAVDRFRDLDGVVLDLRGNPGGIAGLAMGVGGHFLDERLALGTMRTRQTTLDFVVNPQRVSPDGRRVEPFAGPLAILVDGLSGSTSEIFAAGMQALGRARVFGEPTAGEALPALVVELPNGDHLMHAVADFTAPDGTRLEGRGVRPDEPAAPDRASLLAGDDPALLRALDWIARGEELRRDGDRMRGAGPR